VKKIWVASAVIAVTTLGCGGGGDSAGGGMSRDAIIDAMAQQSEIPRGQAECIVDALDGKVDLEKIAKAESSADISSEDAQAVVDATMGCIGIDVPTTG